MTRDETKLILDRITKLYMTQSRRLTKTEKTSMLNTWTEEFANETYEDVNKAVSLYSKSGKPFMPNVPDIQQELINMEDTDGNRLFNRLARAAEMAANPVEHIVIDDLGGFRWNEELQRKVYYHAETHVTTDYTQTDFADLPQELQEYAEDIEGLQHLWKEIESNRFYARQRFLDRLPEIRRRLDEADM